MKNVKLNKLIKISLLSAIAFLLMFLEFAMPIFPSFLKLDISDLPALIGAFAFGPIEGVIIEFIKNLLHGMFNGQTVYVGEFANFVVGSIFVLVSGYIYRRRKTKTNAIIALVAGTIVMSIGASILNYFIFLPLYSKAFHAPLDAFVGMGKAVNSHITSVKALIVLSIFPFNLLKGVIISAITAATYKSISPILHKESKLVDERRVV